MDTATELVTDDVVVVRAARDAADAVLSTERVLSTDFVDRAAISERESAAEAEVADADADATEVTDARELRERVDSIDSVDRIDSVERIDREDKVAIGGAPVEVAGLVVVPSGVVLLAAKAPVDVWVVVVAGM